MPLKSGSSNSAFKFNIKELIASGRPKKQALAIAYKKAGKKRKVGNSNTMKRTKRLKTQRKMKPLTALGGL